MLSHFYYLKGQRLEKIKQYKAAEQEYKKALRSKNQNPDWNYRLGFVLSKAKSINWKEAEKHFRIAVDGRPNKAQWHYRLGFALEKQKRWDEAIAAFDAALAIDANKSKWHLRRGICLMHLKKWSHAEEAFRDAVERDNTIADHYNRLAEALRKQGKWWQEVEALKSAIALEDQHPTWHYRLGEALEVMNRYQQAATSYGKAIEFKKGKAESQWHYRQGYCYAREGHDGKADLNAARKAYRLAIEKDDKLNSKRFGIGVFHQLRGHWPQAADAYKEQLTKRPWDAELNYRLGMAYDRCYEWNEAEKRYIRALTLDVDKPDWHYRLGFVRERQSKYTEAAQAYQYAAQRRSRYTPYWFYRWGYVLEKAGEFEQACEAYFQTRVVRELHVKTTTETPNGLCPEKLNPDPLETYRGEFQTKHLQTIQSFLREDTTKPELWWQLGNAYEIEENWVRAAEAYQHALSRVNNHKSEWYFRLGYVLSQRGIYKEACEAFRNTSILQRAYGAPRDQFDRDDSFQQAAIYTEYYENLMVEEKTILYESFHGSSMSCNPYAIFMQMLENKEFEDWKHVWVVNDLGKVPSKFKNKENIFFIKRDSDAYMRHLAKCQVLINNSTFPHYFIRKHDQKYLNTWHGTPWKTMGKDIKNNFMEHKNTQRNFFHASHIISPNPHTTEVLINRYDISENFTGVVAETGYPRIDLTLNASNEDRKQLRKKLRLQEDKKVILYAPTWRGTLGSPEVETKQLLKEVKQLNALGCHLLFRGHYFVESAVFESALGHVVVPENISSNELLSVVDILVTDYSSISFDFMATGRQIIFYLNDFDKYKEERGLYFEPSELPGDVCYDLSDLTITIRKALEKQLPSHPNYPLAKKKFCPHEDGSASSRVIDLLFTNKKMTQSIKVNKNRKKILFFGGEFNPNGITTSFLNLLTHIEKDLYSVSITIDPNAVSREEERLEQFARVPKEIKILPRAGRMNRTVEEKWIEDKFNHHHTLQNDEMWDIYKNLFAREFLRMYGHAKFDTIVDFTGYSRFWCSILGCSASPTTMRKSVYQHNDKHGEWTQKFPNLESVFNLYWLFNSIISVSKPTMELNRKNLSSRFLLKENMFQYCDNLQNPNEVLMRAEETLSAEEERELFGRSETTFITMGRLSVEKDHAKLIRAFANLRESEPNIKLLILGDGPLRPDLSRLIKDLGQEESICLLGRRFNPFPFLKKADCFVLSSNHEGQPMVLFEAMILRKPIISTDIVGSRSAIEGRSGFLVENSEEGLLQGLRKFMAGDLSFNDFDINEYQQEALSMFYHKVCGERVLK